MTDEEGDDDNIQNTALLQDIPGKVEVLTNRGLDRYRANRRLGL